MQNQVCAKLMPYHEEVEAVGLHHDHHNRQQEQKTCGGKQEINNYLISDYK